MNSSIDNHEQQVTHPTCTRRKGIIQERGQEELALNVICQIVLFSIMASAEKTEECPFADIFNEDETERNFLLSKPTCFIIFGKPGSGKTTLARNIAQAWKCIHVEASSVLEEAIATETETGTMLQSLLVNGHSIPDELVLKLMIEKLKSPEVSHFGYIITEIPSLAQESMTTLKQVKFVKNLELQPDVIINIKCSDYDLCQRISGQRQHSATGYIYSREQWDPEIIESRRRRKRELPKDGKFEEEEEEEQEEEELSYCSVKTSRIILNGYGESGQPCLVPNFSGIALSFSPLS
ncbi:hypothetical protein STEG23_026690 [Scotinomys teguina]